MSENRFVSKFLGIALLVLTVAALVPIAGDAQSAKQPGNSSSAAQLQTASAKQVTVIGNPTAQKALLDQYCVVCHSDKGKAGNLSLQSVDINAVGDHPEIWERVIRKLRAGMMPPPGMPRPPLAKYEQLRDWLEAEVDRKAAAHPNPGSVVLHRLNRTEYANAIRDLLDLQIDATTLLPPDDSARGFDNVAGSLTISPTLLEAYTTAATRISRMAVGFWKSPTAAAYIAPPDSSQNQHIEGLPFGTRGGMAVRHTFPSDGEYRFSVQNLGIGKFIPGEKLVFLIDNQMVETRDYKGVGLECQQFFRPRRIHRRFPACKGRLAPGRRHISCHELSSVSRFHPSI